MSQRAESDYADFEPFSKLLKEFFGDKVEKVLISSRIAESSCVHSQLPSTADLQTRAHHEGAGAARQLDDFVHDVNMEAFDDKKLKPVKKKGLYVDNEDENKKLEGLKTEFESLNKLPKELFSDKVEKVLTSSRMAASPTVHSQFPSTASRSPR